MFRPIASVIFGYLSMIVIVMAAFALALVFPDFAFREGSNEATSGWLAYAILASLVAAVVGGRVALAVARRREPVFVLAGLVMVLGLASAAANRSGDRPPTRVPAGTSVMERAAGAVRPTWYAATLPFVGAAGALAGGGFRRRIRPEDSVQTTP